MVNQTFVDWMVANAPSSWGNGPGQVQYSAGEGYFIPCPDGEDCDDTKLCRYSFAGYTFVPYNPGDPNSDGDLTAYFNLSADECAVTEPTTPATTPGTTAGTTPHGFDTNKYYCVHTDLYLGMWDDVLQQMVCSCDGGPFMVFNMCWSGSVLAQVGFGSCLHNGQDFCLIAGGPDCERNTLVSGPYDSSDDCGNACTG